MLNRRWLLRKCVVLSVVFVVTCISLHFKGQSKIENDFSNEENSFSISHHLNRKLQQTITNQTSKQPAKNDSSQRKIDNKEQSTDNNRQSQTPTKKILTQKQSKTTESPVPTSQIKKDNITNCISPAYKEFPNDLFSQKARSRGAIIFHLAIVLYMFYCLAIVCDLYFLPSLEECSQRLELSEDVAGATFMAAGSSAPELFTAILGVFIAKGDVGTGTIVGSAVFNILFVIGLCALYTTSAKLNWWPVARDSTYYIFTVLVLIVFIYDGRVNTFESFVLLMFYALYIAIMSYNADLKELVFEQWQLYDQSTQDEFESLKANSDGAQYRTIQIPGGENRGFRQPNITVFEAANLVIIKHKRLFRPTLRFRSAAYLIIYKRKKAQQQQQLQPPVQFPQQVHHLQSTKSIDSTARMSILPDEEIWRRIPDPNVEGWFVWSKWAVIAPVHAALFYTVPNCKQKPHLFLVTFFMSILWTAIFSYIMVWMVVLIGFTLGIPDSIMGITFLAAGTSVPDAYASIHVAKQGQGDMAVSNSIGSNVFDILVGLALPWFIETAIVHPGTVALINSKGLVYAVVLLFLSLLMTIYLFHKYKWTLNPQLGTALLITYGVFLVISAALEFNIFGVVNPPTCPD